MSRFFEKAVTYDFIFETIITKENVFSFKIRKRKREKRQTLFTLWDDIIQPLKYEKKYKWLKPSFISFSYILCIYSSLFYSLSFLLSSSLLYYYYVYNGRIKKKEKKKKGGVPIKVTHQWNFHEKKVEKKDFSLFFMTERS